MSAIPALREGEAGGLPMQGQPELLIETLSQTNKQKDNGNTSNNDKANTVCLLPSVPGIAKCLLCVNPLHSLCSL
jgi:hypothetical protein